VSDEEGLICDDCGNRIGPLGCCGTIKALQAERQPTRGEVAAYRLGRYVGEADGIQAALDVLSDATPQSAGGIYAKLLAMLHDAIVRAARGGSA
jgi:hypothetical protein